MTLQDIIDVETEKVRVQSRAEGKAEEKEEFVLSLYFDNMPLDFIVKHTKLSVDEVKQIIAKYKQ